MVNIYSPSVNAKIIRPDVSDRCVPGQRPKRRRVEIDKHTELIMRNQLKGRNCDFYKERTAIGISTGREGREKDTSSRARVWSLERAAGISLSREKERKTDIQTHTQTERKRDLSWLQLQRLKPDLPGLNSGLSACQDSRTFIGFVKGFTLAENNIFKSCVAHILFKIFV